MEISKETATDIALAHREIEASEGLLKDIRDARKRHEAPDIRDAFGRPQGGLQLGIPSGNNSQRLFQVQWSLAEPVIQAHIEAQRARLYILTEKARIEIHRSREAGSGAPCPSLLPWQVHNPGDLAQNRANIICEGADVIVCPNIPVEYAIQVVSAHNAEPVSNVSVRADRAR